MNPAIRPRPLRGGPRVAALAARVEPFLARVHEEDLRWLAERPDFDPDPPAAVRALVAAIHACVADRAEADEEGIRLRARVSGAPPEGRREVLEHYLRATTPLSLALAGDLLALRRDLDLDALLERLAGRAERQGIRVELAVQAIGALGAELSPEQWEEAEAQPVLRELTLRERRPATRRAAVRALAAMTGRLIASGRAGDPADLRLLRERVRDGQESPWIRRRALEVVRGLPPALARHLLAEAISAQSGREPFLLRARGVELLLEQREPWTLSLAARAVRDPSELVRACLVDGLGRRFAEGDDGAEAMLGVILTDDPEPRIRARAAHALRGAGGRGLLLCAEALRDVPMVARVAAEVASDVAYDGMLIPPQLRVALEEAQQRGDPALTRAATMALHVERVAQSPAWTLAAPLASLRPGETATLDLPPGISAMDVAQILVIFAERGFGYGLEPQGQRLTVTRGDAQGPALWRLLHELQHPAPAKRQGHSHLTGRLDTGRIRVPPGGLAEESATGVPGQRVRLERLESWGPRVPMVDDYLHATTRRQVLVVSAEGLSVVRPPEGTLPRARAWARLVWRYGQLDQLRGSDLQERDDAPRYTEELRALGFETTLRGPGSREISRLHGALNPLSYLLGMGESTVTHLAVVLVLLLGLLLGRVSWARAQVRAARASLPLVIGGWGTRGKSGTERLKAGMFEGFGVPLLSKTTGCEAMVLHGPPGGHALELFLFRAYDRATIWEQVDVLRLASGLGARAMLWECMGLNPAYVKLLQAGWMRDDLSTLTNAYPDHEDIQGPTGLDVATVLGGFSPPGALLLCTEENMLPVIAEEAMKRGTVVEPVDRLARELVPRDLIDRMPYAEHPSNVALAASVAGALGLDRTEAIGFMAEHVVPDLGALVIYPRARHLAREVVFANGMSANDTLSFKHNWRHTGFAAHDHAAEPARWLVTVVNNRADRVARSRVFAAILVNDANAHRHVLIGTNLRGLGQYIDAAIDERLTGARLEDPAARAQLFAHLRLVEPAALGERCGERLGAPEELRAAWRSAAEAVLCAEPTLSAARAAAEAARPSARALEEGCAQGAGLTEALIEALARWTCQRAALEAAPEPAAAAWRELMRATLVFVDDPGTSGDQIIATALQAAPPGAEVRLMGVQNIKGTGLDFAYQWVFWRELWLELQALTDRASERRAAALEAIDRNPFGSALACEAALEVLRPLLADPELGPRATEVVRRVESRLAALLAARSRGAGSVAKTSRVRTLAERVLDPFDAVLRARRARQILADLANGRVAHRRAQAELKRLSVRQKGGWLKPEPEPGGDS